VFRTQLSASVLALHSVQIHHHDIAERNVLVDRTGRVTLIDLNTAEEISGRCRGCPDAEALEELGMDVEEYDG
jgi:tRNA A-37 threonylcarbamoyl transferase component Bud32